MKIDIRSEIIEIGRADGKNKIPVLKKNELLSLILSILFNSKIFAILI